LKRKYTYKYGIKERSVKGYRDNGKVCTYIF